MLSVTGLNHFYYVRDFTDMRCKHSRVLSIIRERLHREPCDGDVFIVMSRNRRIVRMFSFDNRSYSLFEKKFVAGYQFMKVERNRADTVYRIDWKDVVLILENPIVKVLKIRQLICLFTCGFAIVFSTFIAVNQRFKHDRTATYNRLKKGIVEKGNLLTESYKL